MYYTIQCNILALTMFGVLLICTVMNYRRNGSKGKTGYFARFEMVCVIDLLLTMIVYWLLLAPGAFNMGSDFGLWSFGNLSVHFITPLLCLIDYILFAEPHHLKYRDVYAILIYPLSYVAFSSIVGLMGYVYRLSSVDGSPVNFPYFFFDYDQVGAKAILYILALIFMFLVFSHMVYLLDRKWKKPVLIGKSK